MSLYYSCIILCLCFFFVFVGAYAILYALFYNIMSLNIFISVVRYIFLFLLIVLFRCCCIIDN